MCNFKLEIAVVITIGIKKYNEMKMAKRWKQIKQTNKQKKKYL